MNNGINFFGWIRDGVRQSVLLGVSDAVEQLGAPPAEEELHPSVSAFLTDKASGNNSSTAKLTSSSGRKTGGRRRLGKSLKEIGSESPQ